MVTVWWSAAHLIQYSFLNPDKTITSENYAQQINEMHPKLQCLPSTDQQKGPNSSPQQCPITCRTTNSSKVEQIGLQRFASSTIFTWPLTNWPPFLQASQLFARKMLPQTAGCRTCFLRVHWIPKHGYLHYRNKQTYSSLAKMYSL